LSEGSRQSGERKKERLGKKPGAHRHGELTEAIRLKKKVRGKKGKASARAVSETQLEEEGDRKNQKGSAVSIANRRPGDPTKRRNRVKRGSSETVKKKKGDRT